MIRLAIYMRPNVPSLLSQKYFTKSRRERIFLVSPLEMREGEGREEDTN